MPLVSRNYNDGSGAGQVTNYYPAGIQADDLIFWMSTFDGGSTSIFMPSGFTQIHYGVGSGENLVLAYRRATGTEVENDAVVLTHNSGTEDYKCWLVVYRGMNWAAPIPSAEAYETGSTGSSYAEPPPVTLDPAKAYCAFTMIAVDADPITSNITGGDFTDVWADNSGVSTDTEGTHTEAHDFSGVSADPFGGNWQWSLDSYASGTVAFELSLEDPPEAPTNLTGTPEGLSADLSWTAPASGDAPASYSIERQSSTVPESWAEIALIDASLTSYKDALLEDQNTYEYRVRGVNSGGSGAYSNIVSVDIDISAGGDSKILLGSTPIAAGKLLIGAAEIQKVYYGAAEIWPPSGGGAVPLAPVLNTPTGSVGAIDISWSQPANAYEYRLWRSVNSSGGPWTEIYEGAAPLYQDTVAHNQGDAVYYKVQALGLYGASDDSNIEVFNVPVLGDINLEFLGAQWDNSNTNWSPVTNFNIGTYYPGRKLLICTGYYATSGPETDRSFIFEGQTYDILSPEHVGHPTPNDTSSYTSGGWAMLFDAPNQATVDWEMRAYINNTSTSGAGTVHMAWAFDGAQVPIVEYNNLGSGYSATLSWNKALNVGEGLIMVKNGGGNATVNDVTITDWPSGVGGIPATGNYDVYFLGGQGGGSDPQNYVSAHSYQLSVAQGSSNHEMFSDGRSGRGYAIALRQT